MANEKIILYILFIVVLAGMGFLIYQSSNNTSPRPVPVVSGKCYVGGCSGEICSDQEGMVSTCIYRAEYACYKNAKCERQASGQCGWTQTSGLSSCLSIDYSAQVQ